MEVNFTFKEKIKYQKINKKNNNQKLRIFNDEFVTNNKSNFKIIFNEKELSLSPFLDITNNTKSNIIEITLVQTNQITDLSNMFSECEELYLFPGLCKLNIEKVTNISNLFKNCKIRNIPDLSKWNTSNIINMSGLFRGCSLLFSLPDISKWNTSKVIDMSYVFMGCSSLKQLPEISKWDTSNVKHMNYMFGGCSQLEKLPDISKWNVGSIRNMSFMFYGCKSLSVLPDISVWDTKEVINMTSMFVLCSGLNSLPELDKWNINKLVKYSHMFDMCKLNLNMPKFIKKFNNYNEKSNLNIDKIKPDDNKKINETKELKNINIKSLDKYYSKNYLCCIDCKGIPTIIIKNNEDAILSCMCCNISELVKISDILNLSTKWIKRVFYQCNVHKQNDSSFAYKYCKSCNLFLCKECEINHIKNGKHELEYIFNLEINFCEKHSSKITKFCENCKNYICNLCSDNEHKSHKLVEFYEKDKLNLNEIQNMINFLEKTKYSKKNILEKIEDNFEDEDSDKKLKMYEMFKNDLKEIDNYKILSRILYFSSKKVTSEKYKDEIINNYLGIFNYIKGLYTQTKIKKFDTLVKSKINKNKIKISKEEKNFLLENMKNTSQPITNISNFNTKKIL